MSSNNGSALSQSVALWKGASTDNEKLAALMMITRLFKVEESDGASRRTLFQCIGFEFLDRLLKSPVPEGCCSNTYLSLAMSLLSSYATDEEMLQDPGMMDKMPMFLDCLGHSEPDVASDAAQCLLALSSSESGRKHLLSACNCKALFQCASSTSPARATALQIIQGVLASDAVAGREISQYAPLCNKLVAKLSEKFRQVQDSEKFEIARSLEFFVMYACSHGSDQTTSNSFQELVDGKQWKEDVHHGLFDVLRSRLSADLRARAFALLVPMVGLCGVDWMVPQCLESGKSSLLVLCVSLVTVEINVHLADVDHDTCRKLSSSARTTLLDCFRIMEAMISGVASLADVSAADGDAVGTLSIEVILSLHGSITDCLRTVLYFLSCVPVDMPGLVEDNVVVGAARLVAVWAEEEVEMLRSELSSSAAVLKVVAESCSADSVFRSLDDLWLPVSRMF